MLREDLVDGDVDILHVERSVSMMCSGSHLYSCFDCYHQKLKQIEFGPIRKAKLSGPTFHSYLHHNFQSSQARHKIRLNVEALQLLSWPS
jgi:hypothetical protein